MDRNVSKIELRSLTANDEAAFLQAFFRTERSDPNFAHYYEKGMSFQKYVQILRNCEQGIGLPTGHVPSSCLFGFVGHEIVGRLSLRFELNEFLMKIGGHIGYVVVPEHRRNGYATQMLQISLERANDLGLDRVLLTCNDDNVASQKTIEKCGGVLEDIVSDPEHGTKRRYWIDLRRMA